MAGVSRKKIKIRRGQKMNYLVPLKNLLLFLLVISFVVISFHQEMAVGTIQGRLQENQGRMRVSLPTLDGVISPEEYQVLNNISSFLQVYVSVVGAVIYFGLVGKTTGWVAIGIDPESGMKGADIVIGWVVNGNQAFVVDAYGDTGTSHKRDEESGGTFDIIAWEGTEANGVTTIEFVRLLNTTDQEHDKAIPDDAETINIIWAIGPDTNGDNDQEKHDERGYYTLIIKSGNTVTQQPDPQATEKVDGTTQFLFHAGIGLLLGLVLYVGVHLPTSIVLPKKETNSLQQEKNERSQKET